MAFASALPVMGPLAPFAAALAALAAAVLGVPLMRLALRLDLRTLGAAVVSGAIAGALAPIAGAMLLLALPGDPQMTSLTFLRRTLTQSSPTMAAFGAAVALVYWSKYLGRGWASRHVVAIAIGAASVTAVIFYFNHEIR